MSAARVKYGSAFSRVISSKSALNHPFSIRNILNLDEQSGDDTSRDIKTITGPHYVECYSSPRKLERHLPNDSLTAPTPNLNFIAADNSWPAWVYATRYSRHGIPPGKFIKLVNHCILFSIFCVSPGIKELSLSATVGASALID